MMTRERLPNRRGSRNINFETNPRPGVGPNSYNATVGYFADGRVAEVFLRAGKSGTDLSIQSQETAIAVSFALQYGCPVDALRAAMPRMVGGEAEGAIGRLLDLLAEEAELECAQKGE